MRLTFSLWYTALYPLALSFFSSIFLCFSFICLISGCMMFWCTSKPICLQPSKKSHVLPLPSLMIAKVFALALVEQTSAPFDPCQSSAIGPEVFPQTIFALFVQHGEMKTTVFCGGYHHQWFHRCFCLYEYWALQDECKGKKQEVLNKLEASCFELSPSVTVTYNLCSSTNTKLTKYSYLDCLFSLNFVSLKCFA